MNSLVAKYRSLKTRDKIVAFIILTIFVGVLVWMSDTSINPLIASGVTLAGLAFIDLAIRHFSKVSTTIVIIIHFFVSVIVSLVYASYNLYEYRSSPLAFSFIYLVITSVLLTLAAIKWSIGRMWVTLLLIYTALDVGGLLLMGLVGNTTLFFIPVAGILALIPRCLHWRTILRRQHKETFKVNLRDLEKSKDYLRTVLASEDEGVSIYNIPDSKIGLLAYEDRRTVRYLHPVHSKDTLKVRENGVVLENRDYTPILVEMRKEAEKAHRRNKKRRKKLHASIVLINAKGDQSMDLAVAPKGYQRNKKAVSVLSTVSLVQRIKDGL